MKYHMYRRIKKDVNHKEEEQRLIQYAHSLGTELLADDITLCTQSFSQFKQNALLDKAIGKLKRGDVLIIDSLESLGNTSAHILKRLSSINKIGVTLDLDKQNFILKPNDNIFKILDSLLRVEDLHRAKRNNAAKDTQMKNNTKPGRKKAKKIKSMFDQYKNKILRENHSGITNKKIVERIGIGNPQSLGKFIKRMKNEIAEKEKLDEIRRTQNEAYGIDTLIMDKKGKIIPTLKNRK